MQETQEREGGWLANFPQDNFEAACFHALGLVERNREYLEQRLERLGGDEKAAQSLADTQAACVRLDRVLSEMMALLRCMRGEAQPMCGVFDLRALARSLAEQKEPIQRELGIELALDCPEDEPLLVYADEEWAEQICLQLLSNALHACSRGGHIALSLREEAGRALLCVEDDGCGLPGVSPEADLENRRRFMGGAQAGLLLCREYSRRMGWSVELCAGEHGGAKAVVTVPLNAELPPSQYADLREQDEQERQHRRFRRQRFLFGEISMLSEGE